MAKPPLILLLTDDPKRRDAWLQVLAESAVVCADPALLRSGEFETPDLILTDHLPITQPLGPVSARLASGEVGILGLGAQGTADVVLPEDCTGRELRLASRLLVEVVRLRRQLREEIRTQQALRSMAMRDPLTGLANRRQWDQELTSRIKRLQTDPPAAALAIALLDLDHFKPVNDRLGHVAGDLVLQRVAQRLAANVAEPHLVARLGGDEFGVLLSGILTSDVLEVVDTIRRSIEHKPAGCAEGEPPITASAGVAILTRPWTLRPLEALTIADRALRDAKAQGRGRTLAREAAAS